MKIVRFRVDDYPKYGIVQDGSKRVIGIKGDPLYTQVEPSGEFYELDEVRLLSPTIPRSKVVCCVNNQHFDSTDDLAEESLFPTDTPIFSIRPNTAVIGPNDPVALPRGVRELNVSTQIGVVAKTLVRDIEDEQAADFIAGYVAGSIFSVPGAGAADLLSANATAWDNSVALGPSLLVEEDFRSADIDLITQVDGDDKLTLDAGNFHWRVERVFAAASRMMTLLPGDIVFVGAASQLPLVHAGQTVTSEVQPIGSFDNRIVSV